MLYICVKQKQITMKNIIKNIDKQIDLLRNLIQIREEEFYDKSEKWQESEEGIISEYKIHELNSSCNQLLNILKTLKKI